MDRRGHDDAGVEIDRVLRLVGQMRRSVLHLGDPGVRVGRTLPVGVRQRARETDVIERDGKKIPVPRYGDGRGDDCLEGEVAAPATMIAHEHQKDAVAPDPESVAPDVLAEHAPTLPAPELAAVHYERERIDAWIRNRLIAYPLASCLRCRKPFIAGQDLQEVSNGEARARFHRACYAEWLAEREAAARQALGLEG